MTTTTTLLSIFSSRYRCRCCSCFVTNTVLLVVVDVIAALHSPLFTNRCCITISSRGIIYAACGELCDFSSSFYIRPTDGIRIVVVVAAAAASTAADDDDNYVGKYDCILDDNTFDGAIVKRKIRILKMILR